MSLRARALLAIVVSVAAIGSTGIEPATAAPKNARITSVAQRACGSLPCTPGSAVQHGDLVGGTLEVRVHAEADLGLEWVRLEAQNPGSTFFYCLELWTADGAASFDQALTWDTAFWTDPRKTCTVHCSNCIENSRHHHGAPTENLPFNLRVVARERGRDVSGAADAISNTFAIKVQNAPVPPQWSNDPRVETVDGRSSVTLQWQPSATEQAVPPEPAQPPADVKEYRFLRIGPDGARTAFAISASDPAAQGCSKVSTFAYRCVDGAFDGAPAGTYRYAVATVRAGFTGEPCQLGSGSCVVSALGPSRSVTIASSAQATTSPGASPTGSTEPTGSAAPVSVDPSSLAAPSAGGGSRPVGSSRSTLPIALGGVLLLAGAGGLVWLRFRRT